MAWRRVENEKYAYLLAEIGTAESGDMVRGVHDHEELIGGAQVLDGARPPACGTALDDDENGRYLLENEKANRKSHSYFFHRLYFFKTKKSNNETFSKY